MVHHTGTDIGENNTALAFGRFDGLHRGHRAVLEQTVRMKDRGLTPVLVSFDFQPPDLLGEETVIYTEAEKATLLESLGLDFFVSFPFTSETMKMEPEAFVRDVLLDSFGAKVLVVGADCRFGKNVRGDTALLQRLSALWGFELVVCKMEKDNGRTITTTLIREELTTSSLDGAGRLLGSPFFMIGEVVHGKALGRTAALPTANLGYGEHKLLPPHGIYATLTRMDGRVLKGLSIIGLRPTVDNLPHATVETYLLDFHEDVYGKTMTLEVHARVRDIRKFKDLHEVKIQVEKDIESVRDYLEGLE